MKTDADIIFSVLSREGGTFTNLQADRGGPTKWGITIPTLEEYCEHPVSLDDIQALTRDEAFDILHNLFAVKPRFAEIADPDLRALAIDTAVLHGRSRAAKWLQDAVSVKVDGVIGDKTLAAVNRRPARQVYGQLLARRFLGVSRCVQAYPDQVVHLAGWINRCNEFIIDLAGT